jgi:hypothetical protein
LRSPKPNISISTALPRPINQHWPGTLAWLDAHDIRFMAPAAEAFGNGRSEAMLHSAKP